MAYHILVRKILFQAPNQETLYFRALTGKIDKSLKSTYQTNNLRLTLHQGTHQLRPFQDGQELLVQLELPAGETTLTLEYELPQ